MSVSNTTLPMPGPSRLPHAGPAGRPVTRPRRGRLLGLFWRARRGVAAVEFALLLPVLMLLSLGCVELAQYVVLHQKLQCDHRGRPDDPRRSMDGGGDRRHVRRGCPCRDAVRPSQFGRGDHDRADRSAGRQYRHQLAAQRRRYAECRQRDRLGRPGDLTAERVDHPADPYRRGGGGQVRLRPDLPGHARPERADLLPHLLPAAAWRVVDSQLTGRRAAAQRSEMALNRKERSVLWR
ncbi:MAG: hypothetical protein GVY27_08260 [Deinococcus-Thermus bacterium]|nr:hypothetical protein [Deinococcota bacterium]